MSRRSENLLNVLIGVLSLIAVAMGSLRLKDWLFPTSGPPVAVTRVKDWTHYAEAGERLGPQHAILDIVMFSDFQCPYCRTAAANLERIQGHNRAITVVYRHFPLSGHPSAMSAARASVCAARQGSFKGMHDKLFLYQDSLGRKPWAWYAAAAGVSDTITFDRCLEDSTVIAQVKRDSVAGVKLGVSGTPTLLIKDLRIDGSPSPEELNRYVSEALRENKRH
jgi:protein-disulfide isomerase